MANITRKDVPSNVFDCLPMRRIELIKNISDLRSQIDALTSANNINADDFPESVRGLIGKDYSFLLKIIARKDDTEVKINTEFAEYRAKAKTLEADNDFLHQQAIDYDNTIIKQSCRISELHQKLEETECVKNMMKNDVDTLIDENKKYRIRLWIAFGIIFVLAITIGILA